jgi:hypothetical protein
MAEIREKKWNLALRYSGVAVVVLLAATMLYFYYLYPQRELGPEQPILFSHRLHAGVKEINCRFCHPFAERSRNPGIPELQKCFFCHEHIITKHPQILKERQHYDTKTPVPWVKIFYVPDHVKFNHKPHIQYAKLDCTDCHGDVKTMDRLQKLDFQMQFCITCHQERKAQLDCWLACHH